jgi:hypothetical protein
MRTDWQDYWLNIGLCPCNAYLFAYQMIQVFTIISNFQYFPGLWSLLNSLWFYHSDKVPVVVFSIDLSCQQIEAIKRLPLLPDVRKASNLPFTRAGAWEAKQQVFGALLEEWQTVFLLDADLVITSPLYDVFEQAEAGYILAPGDGPGKTYGPEYSIYHEGLVTVDYLATGCVCMEVRRHWDLAGLWSFVRCQTATPCRSGTSGAPMG